MTNQEAIEVLKLNNPFMAGKDKENFSKAIDKGIEALKNQKTGHWEYVQYDGNPKIGNYHCSVCRHIIIPFENQNYCPNCGAKMKGESNGK